MLQFDQSALTRVSSRDFLPHGEGHLELRETRKETMGRWLTWKNQVSLMELGSIPEIQAQNFEAGLVSSFRGPQRTKPQSYSVTSSSPDLWHSRNKRRDEAPFHISRPAGEVIEK